MLFSLRETRYGTRTSARAALNVAFASIRSRLSDLEPPAMAADDNFDERPLENVPCGLDGGGGSSDRVSISSGSAQDMTPSEPTELCNYETNNDATSALQYWEMEVRMILQLDKPVA